MSDKDKLKNILSNITPHQDYGINDYYGVAYMKIKKNGYHQIKLIHDYKNGNMKLSSAMMFKDFDVCLNVMSIIEKNSLDTDIVETDDEKMKELFS